MERKRQAFDERRQLAETEARGSGAAPRENNALGRRNMNVAVLKTKAEQALSDRFASVAGLLPGGAAVAQVRRDAISRFATLGLPHRRVEAWKYTDLRVLLKDAIAPALGPVAEVLRADVETALGPLAAVEAVRLVFVDGLFAPALSHQGEIEGLAVAPLSVALVVQDDAELLQLTRGDDDAMLALNAAYVTDGLVAAVAKGVKLAKPLMIVSLRSNAEPQLATTRNVVNVGDGAEATIIEAFVALPGAARSGEQNAVTEIGVGKGAKVSHIKTTLAGGLHLGSWLVDVGAGADYGAFQVTAGPAVARNGLSVEFKGKDARIDLSGVFLARGNEHVDTTLVVDHAVPSCTSRELFKGVLEDHGRGVFQGKVIVRPDAQKTDGKQMAQVLMLSPEAEFDSKPELEIYADDVVCGHGSTTADLDEDLLFYCRSRGIPVDEARALLIESFIGEALQKVEREDVRTAFEAVARGWLGAATPNVDKPD
jgi:Fe-S cluster assembly protein SufD